MVTGMHTLITNQWRTSRSSFIGIGIILVIAACMLNTALTLLLEVDRQYDERSQQLHTAQIVAIAPRSAATAGLLGDLQAISGVAQVDAQDAVLADATIRDFRGTDFTIRTLVFNADATRTLNRFETVQRFEATQSADVAVNINQYIAQFGEYQPGDTITMSIDGQDHTMRVGNVIEEMEFGNAGSGILVVTMPQAGFEAFIHDHATQQVVDYAIAVEPEADISTARQSVEQAFDSHDVRNVSIHDADTVRGVRTMVSQLIVLVLIAFAVLITIVSLALCTFHIANTIDKELATMGILKALGYTSPMIEHAIITPYLITCLCATLLGSALSTILTPVLGTLIALQSGFSFHAAISPAAWIVTLLCLSGITLLFATLGVRRVRSIQPIEAVRGNAAGRAQHIVWPLTRMPGNAPIAIALQQAGSARARNTLITIITASATLLLAFCATLFYNATTKPNNLYNTLSTETPQITLTPTAGHTQEMADAAAHTPGIHAVIEYTTTRIDLDGTPTPTFVSNDFSAAVNDIHYQGRHPRTAQEIAIGSALADTHPIGTNINATLDDTTRTYTIVGYIQSVNDGGTACELTNAGYTRLAPAFADQPHTLYIYCDEHNTDSIMNTLSTTHAAHISAIANTQTMRTITQQMYGTLMAAVGIGITAIALLLTALALMMTVRTTLTRERHMHGILKTLGYSSKQLIGRTAAKLLPATITGALIGTVIALLATEADLQHAPRTRRRHAQPIRDTNSGHHHNLAILGAHPIHAHTRLRHTDQAHQPTLTHHQRLITRQEPTPWNSRTSSKRYANRRDSRRNNSPTASMSPAKPSPNGRTEPADRKLKTSSRSPTPSLSVWTPC